jgi:hypothetical protein
MTSLREQYLEVTAREKDVNQRVNEELWRRAENLREEIISTIRKRKEKPVSEERRVALAHTSVSRADDELCIFVREQPTSVDALKECKGYRRVHAVCQHDDVDMKVEIRTEQGAIHVVISMDKAYAESPDAAMVKRQRENMLGYDT